MRLPSGLLPVTCAVAVVLIVFVVINIPVVLAHATPSVATSHIIRAVPSTPRPRLLHLTYRSRHDVPPYVFERFRRFSSGYELRFYDDDDIETFLRTHYPLARPTYQALPTGAHRADLFRYLVLHRSGGVYMDIKTPLSRHLDTLFPDPHALYTVISIMPEALYQGVLAVPPGHPVMADAVINMCRARAPQDMDYNYMHVCEQLYQIVAAYTGRAVLTPGAHAIDDEGHSVHLLQERAERTCAQRDRYGLCVAMYDAEGTKVMDLRDPTFPWKSRP